MGPGLRLKANGMKSTIPPFAQDTFLESQHMVLSNRHTLALWLITLILLLAAAMRISGTADRTVWTDEGWSAWAASDDRVSVVEARLADDRHTPLYFITLSAWRQVAGDSRVALRYLAVLSGILSTAVIYRMSADIFSRRAGGYAALLFAVLGIAVYYAQEIRHYGWLVLSVCLMSLFLLRYLRHPRLKWLILYMVSVAFMLYTLYAGILMLAVQGGVVLLIWRGNWRDKVQLAASWMGAVLIGAPWMRTLFDQMRDMASSGALSGNPTAYTTTLDNLITLTGFLLGGQVALLLGLYLLGTWHIVRDFWPSIRRDIRRLPVRGLSQGVIVLSGAGLFVLMSLLNLSAGTLTLRTLVYLTPMLMLVCGYGLSRLPRPADGLLALTAVAAMLAFTQTIQPRLPYAGVIQQIASRYTPGDPVILESGWDDNGFRYEALLGLPVTDDQVIRTLPWVNHTRPKEQRPVIEQITPILEANRRVWVIQWLQPSVVIPYLEQGGNGFVPVLSMDIPTGKDYQEDYPAHPLIRVMLFERPDQAREALSYGGILSLRDAVLPESLSAGESLHVDLWWSADQVPPLDYSVGVYVMPASEDRVLAQNDAPPADHPTSQWIPGEMVFDRHTIPLPDDLPAGTYRIAVKAYWFGDSQPLLVDGDPYAVVGQITIR